MKKLLLVSALALIALPALGQDKPLVLESGQQKVLPAGKYLQLNASASGQAAMNLGQGTAPSSPNNGDVWITSAGIFVRANGVTIGPLNTGSGSGSVTSVAMTGDGVIFASSVTGSPVTTTGTLAPSLLTQTANTLLAGPSTGSPATPTFRALVGADLPTPGASSLGGIESFAAVSHEWINQISTGGVPSASRPACADLSDSAASCNTDATNASNISSGTLAAARIASNVRIRSFGTTFGDTAGSALSSGSVVYFTVPYSCTITAFNITVDAGTVTFDIWKTSTGTAIPSAANSITASAKPALSTGTALHSTTLTGWTTSVSQNDVFGIQLNTVATAKYAEIDVECDQ